MSVFNWLLIAHLVGDWLLQTEYEATNKARGRFCNRALVKHCVVYTLSFVPFFLLLDINMNWLGLIFVSHMFIDRRWPVERYIRSVKLTSERTIEEVPILMLVVDQIFHILILVPIVVFG